MITSSVIGGRALRDTARRLREAGRVDLRRELTTALKRIPDPVVRDLQAAVKDVPVRGFPYPGRKRPYRGPDAPKALREKVAASIGSKLTTSGTYPKLTIRAYSSKLDAQIKNMARKLDAGVPWRHPVLGNREVWVAEQGRPWWWKTIQPHIKDMRREAHQAVVRVVKQLEEEI
jgi:hypothetical protein